MMNNFQQYSSRERYIIEQWIENTAWLKDIVEDYTPDNTGFHDYKLRLSNGTEIIVEIKEEEYRWYGKTGNLGLDFISAFHFKEESYQAFYVSSGYWVDKTRIKHFLNNEIDVKKFGKLKTCDADIQLFYCEDENKNIVLMKAYNNYLLQDKLFIEYLCDNYRLRINKKSDYHLTDDWESAAFFCNPNTDDRLKGCEIKSIDDLNNIIYMKVNVGYQ